MRILFAGPAGVFRDGVACLLRDLSPCAEIRCADYATASEGEFAADLLVLDGDYVGDALETVRTARRRTPTVPIVVLLTTVDPRIVANFTTAGVAGSFDQSGFANLLVRGLRLGLMGGL